MIETRLCLRCGLVYGRMNGYCRKCYTLGGQISASDRERNGRLAREAAEVRKLERQERLRVAQLSPEDHAPREAKFITVEGVDYEVTWDGT